MLWRTLHDTFENVFHRTESGGYEELMQTELIVQLDDDELVDLLWTRLQTTGGMLLFVPLDDVVYNTPGIEFSIYANNVPTREAFDTALGSLMRELAEF